MKKVVFTDLHRFGCYKDSIQEVPLEYHDQVVYLGDNFDVNCKHEDVDSMVFDIFRHISLCEDNSVPNVISNHEGSYVTHLPVYFIEDEVLYTHGHYIVYSPRAILKWEKREAGLSFFPYYARFITNLFFKFLRPVPDLEQIAAYAAERKCKTIVCGHFHAKVDKVVNGIRVILLPRGRHEIIV